VQAPGELLRQQMEALRAYAERDSQALRGQSFPAWYTPAAWSGSVFDLEDLKDPFSRAQHEQEFDSAVSSASQPGTTGDLVTSQLQGDLLATMERAYRSRLRSSIRNKMHAAARRGGHGSATGTLMMGMQNYVERLIKGSQT
jgi:hypothetical protein